ncbi:MAG: hypothetical protein WD490_10575 [Opitutales bacterium]
MVERYIHTIARYEWREEAAPEVVAAFRNGLPRNAGRRMTRLGLLCARVLREMPGDPGAALVYASSMSEVRTLEGYLDSFPDASPTRFQGSVHPAGAQQALIALGRPIREFYPLVGGTDLFDQALQTVLLAEAQEVILLAGEEKGTWLHDLGLAGNRSFAFALHLSERSEGAQAVLHRSGEATAVSTAGLVQVFDLLGNQNSWEKQSFPFGSWHLKWLL